MRKFSLITLAIAVLVVGGGAFAWTHRAAAPAKPNAEQTVTDFASCQKASGSKILETSPEVCVALNGKRFSQSSTALTANYPISKTKYIAGFDKAPDSLKTALVGSLFASAESSCLANDVANKDAPDDMYYLTVVNATSTTALVHICPSTDTTVLTKQGNTWKNVGSYTDQPQCALVDQYKLSKQLTPTCLTTDGTQQPVTNS